MSLSSGDEAFSIFLQAFGDGFDRQYVPVAVLESYQGRLPKQLLSYWEQYGWCGYANGLFWTVNPKDYEGVLEDWLVESGLAHLDRFHVIARSAFGDLYVWGEMTGGSLNIAAHLGRYIFRKTRLTGELLDVAVQSFFLARSPESNDFGDLFSKAVSKLGRLASDEMYGFVPAMILGGPGTLETLEKVKIVERLTFLSQLEPLQDWGFPDIDSLLDDLEEEPGPH